MIENAILGMVQGIAEWLPVSSEGLLVLIKTNYFLEEGDYFGSIIKVALFLHFGTFLAALLYFRSDVYHILTCLFNYKKESKENQLLLKFLMITTAISGTIGIVLVKGISLASSQFETSSKVITLMIGCLLIGTAILDLKAHRSGYREIKDITIKDSLILGIVQGFAALPGFSRSGLTVSALLLTNFDKTHALKLSFLMSLPIVLAGNIVLHFNELYWSQESIVGLLFSFIFGYATIHLLLKLAEKVKFGYFILFFGILTIVSVGI